MEVASSTVDVQWLEKVGLSHETQVYWNLPPAVLIEEAIKNGEGVLAENGALLCDTGTFQGRAPQDKFTVKDNETSNTVWWGPVNFPFMPEKFDALYNKVIRSLKGKKVYIRDTYAGASPAYRLNVRVVNTLAWHNLFCYNLFLRPTKEECASFLPDFTVINVPEFYANPATDGTRQANFVIINFAKRIILIAGTGYAGEMKKSIFTVLNYLLPHHHDILSMHCSANIDKKGDTAIFFGLSGTGKTTLSADPHRGLIGDDEHGWSDEGIFNFEGGCYAKTVGLNRKKEPQIFDAIKFGSILENISFLEDTRIVDYNNTCVTENTRTAYPLHHICNAVTPSIGRAPKNIFFLTCDAYGVLPPIARLNKGQAMYHFISGYTAKVAGTEVGITEPQIVFSPCFGVAFLPLHPTKYATMLGAKITANNVNVWLVNTGWVGGPYGVGKRVKLAYTRAMITAALAGDLDETTYEKHAIFGIAIPQSCPKVPKRILIPSNTWQDKKAYHAQANKLAQAFIENFEKYADFADDEILAEMPKVTL